ncbi:hypothetical protein [Metallosphaera hakonensis]|uniref:hypothetical protein n=1 Tax=Metallosphaera hakonensis TaxID=79601 RepID=UPI000AEC6815|nr:hypothetical protein [Metallosphaera hakonensis]
MSDHNNYSHGIDYRYQGSGGCSREAGVRKLTLFIGPNLNGKSLLLQCIYNSAKGEKHNLTVDFTGAGECSLNEEFDYVIYMDPYVITYYIYDKYRQYLDTEESEEKGRAFTGLSKLRDDVKAIHRLLDIRELSRDDDIFEGWSRVNNVVSEITEKLKQANREDEAKYLIPLKISMTRYGIEWKDVFGDEGSGVTNLTPSFYPSFVLTATVYSYA